ncbi:cytochrome P450 9e2-like isoform X1 [Periplaneta americana]|uniref:cytochrome P450 9e2-like isoform X1 n=1 Tax=Periplaneta americana TaxID=6978 RepID=UPI0037E705DC
MIIPNFMYWATVFLGLLLVLYLYGTKNYDYFLKRNMPSLQQSPFIGNFGPFLFRKRSYPDHIKWMYDRLKAYSYGGVFQLMTPYVMICDPELIKAVTVKDFDHFTDRNQVVPKDIDPVFAKTLTMLKGEQWKEARSNLTPAFTSSKMKMMFELVSECGVQLVEFLEKCCGNYTPEKVIKIEKGGKLLVVEMRDIFTRFANDIIATAAFGISVDSLTNPKNDFYMMGSDISDLGGKRALIWFGYLLCSPLMRLLNVTFMSKKVINFFKSIVLKTIDVREREGITRPDLIHLLMQAKKGVLEDQNSPTKTKTKLDDDDLAAHAFQFFLAGFHSSATLLCFSTHQLAVHPDIQVRLQEEIDDTLRQCGSNITYEAVQSMKYLDMVLSETLRKYPPGPGLERCCVKEYTLPSDPPVQIHPGDAVLLPVFGLHRDPEYFPDPERFDPDRFSDENKHNIKPYTYLPFGSGPRACIGNRFALMEAKVAMVHLLSRFTLKVVSKTPIPLEITRKGYNMTVDGGFWLGLEQRSKKQTGD